MPKEQTSSEQLKQASLRIDERADGNRQVVLHPEDDDLFVQTGKQVIEACRLGISLQLWMSELGGMLQSVQDWSAQRAGRIRACFCEPRGLRMVLFFVPHSQQFDFELAGQLAELNAQLVKDFNIGMIEVRQVPWKETGRFFNLESAKQVYGERPGSHHAVEA
jgi:hypothetical protein